MERGPREKRELIDLLERLRAVVRGEDLAPDERAGFEFAIADLERDILTPVATDTRPLVDALAGWGPRLQLRHPALARVLAGTVRTLREHGL